MSVSIKTRHITLWVSLSVVGILALCIAFIPPAITLNDLKPKLEQSISEQTGIKAKINGDVHFSLLGGATIVAKNVSIPFGNIKAVLFSIPFWDIFDLQNARLINDILVYKANLKITTLSPQNYANNIKIRDSNVYFINKNYKIIRADFSGNKFIGHVRTSEHKYNLEFNSGEFDIRNFQNNLDIRGKLFPDGSASGVLKIKTNNANRWFAFKYPRIDHPVKMTTNFNWDGGYGFKFSDIHANNVTGEVDLYPNGNKNIKLQSNDMKYDFSSLIKSMRILYRTNFNLDLQGNMKFMNFSFKHLKLDAIGTKENLEIKTVVVDNTKFQGGYIDKDGAHNIVVTSSYNNKPFMCVFSGTPDKWECSKFSYDDMEGKVFVNGDNFDMSIQSNKIMPNMETLMSQFSIFGKYGKINFSFSDVGGLFEKERDKSPRTSYLYAHNKTLKQLKPDIEIFPETILNEIGDYAWDNGAFKFLPLSQQWALQLSDTKFIISGKNIKDLFPKLNLKAFNDKPYTISGIYNKDNVSNLTVMLANHTFTGSANGNNITLKTDILNLDSFISQDYTDAYEELKFLMASPITIPFSLPIKLSLSADKLIYNGNVYKNFMYALKPGTQTFSITDKTQGNLLATISKEKAKYNISLQLNKFLINGKLLSSAMPLNISDTAITANIGLTTWGYIANDMEYNLSGTMDLLFIGGDFFGIGLDEFFMKANNLTTLNAEYALAEALESGKSKLKKMHIVGEYKDGNFKTTSPMELQLLHTDATGSLEITDGKMNATLDMLLRGTAPTPAPIQLKIFPNNQRNYSLSEIMRIFDPAFMRNFVKTHNKF